MDEKYEKYLAVGPVVHLSLPKRLCKCPGCATIIAHGRQPKCSSAAHGDGRVECETPQQKKLAPVASQDAIGPTDSARRLRKLLRLSRFTGSRGGMLDA